MITFAIWVNSIETKEDSIENYIVKRFMLSGLSLSWLFKLFDNFLFRNKRFSKMCHIDSER